MAAQPSTSSAQPDTNSHHRTILLALSGPSCSGKTTLARLLRDALNNTSDLPTTAFIIHEDDFYKTDAEIPVVKTADGRELQDWDCIDSLDLDQFEDMVKYVEKHGAVKNGFESIQDGNAVGEVEVDMSRVEEWSARFDSLLSKERPQATRIAIIDGFLLYHPTMSTIYQHFTVKLLLRIPYSTVKRRREARAGYVTLEGFWEDPHGYVDQIVWPNYVADHKFLFEDGNVEGEMKADVAREFGIQAMPWSCVEDMTKAFEWAAGVVEEVLRDGR